MQAALLLSGCKQNLKKAITLTTLDGGHDWNLLCMAFLSMASLTTSTMDAPRTLLCLQTAQTVVAQRDVLLHSLHRVAQQGGMAAAAVPAWLASMLKGNAAAYAKTIGQQV
jgi:hypothetical protein